jgi:hypothetical protein
VNVAATQQLYAGVVYGHQVRTILSTSISVRVILYTFTQASDESGTYMFSVEEKNLTRLTLSSVPSSRGLLRGTSGPSNITNVKDFGPCNVINGYNQLRT